MKWKIVVLLLVVIIGFFSFFIYFQKSSIEIFPFEDIDKIITGKVIKSICESEEDIGNRQCHLLIDSKYQECVKGTRWWARKTSFLWKTLSCNTGLICQGEGECVCSDDNACKIEDTRKCSGNDRYKICEADENNCLKWSVRKRCARGEVCDQETNKCVVKHCDDGIKNFDEEDVDCGGVDCAECKIQAVCGNGILEKEEICDSDSVACIIESYSGTQICKNDCTGYEICITTEYCGDGIVNGNEQCDDENNVDGDGCDSNCNEVEEVLEEDQYLMSVGDSKQVTINKGDEISVTYEEYRGDVVLVKIKKISTPFSIQETETHTVKVDRADEGSITVTVI